MHYQISKARFALNSAAAFTLALVFFISLKAIGSRSGVFSDSISIIVQFPSVEGLRTGDPVRLQGLRVGSVSQLELPASPGDPIHARLLLEPAACHLMRLDAKAVITPQGLVGQMVVEIHPGSPAAPGINPEIPILGSSSASLGRLVDQVQASFARLDEVTKKAEIGLNQINKVTETIARGEGSLGKFVQHDDAYQKLLNIGTRTEQTLDDLQENLQSLKQSWFLSRMFEERGYYDRETALFNPSADQFRHGFDANRLFDPDSAILTTDGQAMINLAMPLIRSALKSDSELVIAAFAEAKSGEESILKKLTQKRAEAVREYLNDVHNIGYAGLFQWRKETAVGYGSKRPSNWKSESPAGDRVEIVVMTPRLTQARQ